LGVRWGKEKKNLSEERIDPSQEVIV